VVELNVREGGVIELLSDVKDKAGQRLRVIFLPLLVEPTGHSPVRWQCYSANGDSVAALGSDCRIDTSAWELERAHVARLRAALAQTEKDASRQPRILRWHL
jgi:hypothetical protein